MKVAFAGTPEFAATALDRLLREGFAIPLVLTQPDRPAGRGLKPRASAVKTLASTHALPIIQPRSLRLDGKFADDARAARQALLAATPDVIVVAAYGLILPAWTLELPRLGCLNIHASLLPRWRGAAPIQRAIEAGDDRTGVTIMQMDAGLDTGDMLLTGAVEIGARDSAATLHDKLAALGAELIVRALRDADRGASKATPQPAQGVSYASKIDKREAAIDWALPAATIERRVRAFDPFPGASFELDGEQVKLWRSRVVDATPPADHRPGAVLPADDHRLLVACGSGALELLELQRPGGRRIDADQFLQAKALAPGRVLNRSAG